jgi:hypothetical protein
MALTSRELFKTSQVLVDRLVIKQAYEKQQVWYALKIQLRAIGSLKIDLPQMTNEKEVSAIVTIVIEETSTISHPLRSFQISIPF